LLINQITIVIFSISMQYANMHCTKRVHHIHSRKFK